MTMILNVDNTKDPTEDLETVDEFSKTSGYKISHTKSSTVSTKVNNKLTAKEIKKIIPFNDSIKKTRNQT